MFFWPGGGSDVLLRRGCTRIPDVLRLLLYGTGMVCESPTVSYNSGLSELEPPGVVGFSHVGQK